MPRPATVVLILLLVLPGIAWVFGARQPLLENRERTPYPDLNRGTLRVEATFQQIDRAYLERLPLRKAALDATARLNIDVFRDSPNPEVAIGGDGWLFFVPQLQACNGQPPLADPADAAETLARARLASGRTAMVTIPGGKLTVQPERAPKIDETIEQCVRGLERRIGERLHATPGGYDLYRDLQRARARGEDVFLRGDTHWSIAGRERFARAVLETVRPGLADDVGLRRGPEVDRPGDLWKLLGMERADRDATLAADRSPLDPPRNVLLIGDSQMEYAFTRPPAPGMPPLLERVLPGATTCSIEHTAAGLCDTQIQQAETIIYTQVGRNVRQLTETCWRPVWLAAQQLRGPLAAFERLDADAPAGARGLDVPPGATIRVRVRARRDATNDPRLVVIPVAGGDVGVAQQPQAGPPAPCATPAATAGQALVLPVPAGRRVSDLVVDVSSAGGARLEAPQEVALDDRALRAAGR